MAANVLDYTSIPKGAAPKRRLPPKVRRALLLGFATVAIIVTTVAYLLHHRAAVGEQKMMQLLNGDASVWLSGLDIHYQQREVHCTDKQVLDYMANAIRTQSKREGSAGETYEATFTFVGGGVFTTTIYRFDSGFSLSMPADALEETFPTHNVTLPQHMPGSVGALFDFLDAPWQQVSGKQLILPAAQPGR